MHDILMRWFTSAVYFWGVFFCCTGAATVLPSWAICDDLTTYFDPTVFRCLACPDKATSVDGVCRCGEGFVQVFFSDTGKAACIDCSAQQKVPSSFYSLSSSQQCVSCGGDTPFRGLEHPPYDAVVHSGVFHSRTTLGEIIGSNLLRQMSTPDEISNRTLFNYHCALNSIGECVCQNNGKLLNHVSGMAGTVYDLIAVAAEGTSTTLASPNINNYGSSASAITVENLRSRSIEAAVSCHIGSMQACNYLSNLCVLMLYRIEATPCALYLYLKKNDSCGDEWCERPKNLPWLYYTRNSADTLSSPTKRFKAMKEQKLTFVVSVYSLNGTWKGFRSFVEQTNLCRLPNPSAESFLQPNGIRVVSCNLNWAWHLVADPAEFYDLYMVNPENESHWIPVPVHIDYTNSNFNFLSDDDSWMYRPAANAEGTPVSNGFRRRFYIYNNVGALSDIDATFSYVTTIWSSTLVFLKHKEGRHAFQIPFLVLQYASRDLSRLKNSAQKSLDHLPLSALPTADTLRVRQQTFYLSRSKSVERALMITLIVFSIICFITAWIRTYGWMRRRQNHLLDAFTLLRFVVYLCDHISNAYALVVSLFSWYVFVGYKSKHQVDTSLVHAEIYLSTMLYVAVGAKGISVLYSLAEQCNADYFIIDWERSKGQLLRENKIVPVSMWRSTFLANELNELQCLRYWRPLFTMTIILLFLFGLHYQTMTLDTSHALLENDNTTKYFPLFRIAANTFLWIAVALVMYVLEFQIYHRFIVVHPLRAFVDLCSVSNISVVILLESQYGFYIHGESIHAHADVSMEEFQHNLYLESQGNLPVRGLGGQSQCQTFEVYIGPYMRQYLYICYTELQLEHQRSLGKSFTLVDPQAWHFLKFMMGFHRKPRVYSQATLAIKDRINHAFQQSVRLAESTLLVKFVLQNFFNFPPNIMYMNGPQSGEKGGRDLFFFDDVLSYGRALMCGLDLDLFVLYMTLFTAIDFSLHNICASMVITYSVEVLLHWYRAREGLINLSQKTLIDDRFFI